MTWNKIRHFWLVMLLLFSAYSLAAGTLTKIEMSEEADHLALILKCDNKMAYHCLSLSKPDRFVIDLDNVTLKTTLPSPENEFIKAIRSSGHDQYLRLVFDLKQNVVHTATLSHDDQELKIILTPAKKNNKSIPIEHNDEVVENASLETTPATSKQTVSTKLDLPLCKVEKESEPQAEPTPKLAMIPKSKKIVVVIDPGHGGKDPGAAGANGAVEKEVVLKIAKQLHAMLNEEPGFSAVLTRTSDCYLTLRSRLAIARKHHADLFVAVHADAYHHSHATGSSVYALSPRGATSEAARWLAEKENESELGGLGDELADKDALLRSVLIDLSQTHTIESSLQIGHQVLNHLGKLGRLHHPRVEQAAFVVLKSPDIPSILVETGFLSNPLEEEKLTNAEYQHQTAAQIKEGIKQYFIANSPRGTWFSDNRHLEKFAENTDDTASSVTSLRHGKKNRKNIKR
jgi:N-acetylmuramoyl-L-alanine amidase